MTLVVSVVASVAVTYLALLVALLVARPKGNLLGEAVRLLPDLLRLLRRLAADSTCRAAPACGWRCCSRISRSRLTWCPTSCRARLRRRRDHRQPRAAVGRASSRLACGPPSLAGHR
jgi:hypothetical protein